MNTILFLQFLQHFLIFGFSQSSNSFCLESGSYRIGNVDCTKGEIFLRGKFLEIGINNAGFLRTSGNAPLGSISEGQKLGFLAYSDREGWISPNSLPGNSKDSSILRIYLQFIL